MKKICSLVLCVSVVMLITSACTVKQTGSMVKSQRRFAKYIEPPKDEAQGGVVDLSEGPKLKYEANFGPKTPDFDFKIENPY